MKPFSIILLSIVLTLSSRIQAATPGLESAVQTALMNNRDLQAARFAVAKAQGRLAQSGKWANPELELSGLSDVAFRNEGSGAFTVGLSQKFPLTSRLALERSIGRWDLLRAVREIRDRERHLIASVRQSSLAVLEANAKKEALADLLEAAKKSDTLAKERLASGQGSLSEKSLAMVEERRIANELESARATADLQLLELKTLLGLSANEPLQLRDSLKSALNQLSLRVKSRPATLHRPDIDLLLIESEKSQTEIALARAESWEGIRLGIEYTNDRNMDEPEGLGTDNFLGVSVSLPLPVWDQKRGLVEERTAANDEARARLAAAKLEMENAIATARLRIDLIRNRLAGFEKQTLAPVSEAEQELAQAFTNGRVDPRDLFTIRERLANLHLEHIALQAELARALVDLESATGSHPEISRPYLEPAATKTNR
jgi:cobalt-zinc-cadmium efflux system outer membrane protein